MVKNFFRHLLPLGTQRKVERAQTMVEFALVFPLVLLIIFGIVEFGRVIFLYAQIVTASREGARYGTASGDFITAVPKYQDCVGIRNAVRRSAILVDIPDSAITISYDRQNPTTQVFEVISASCPPPGTVRLGDRIIVTVQADFEPLLGLINIPPFTVQSVTRRTILKAIDMGVGGATGGSSTPPVVIFSADSSPNVGEAAGSINVQVQMNRTTTLDVIVPFTIAGTATGGDFSVSTNSVTIPAGSTTAVFPVTIIDDDIYEPAPNEYVIFILGSPINATLGTPNEHTLTIVDNDQPPEVQFQLYASSTEEPIGDPTSLSIAVVLNHRSAVPIDVTFSVRPAPDSSAAPLTDYTITTSPVNIPAMSNGGVIVLFPIAEVPGLDENDETVVIDLVSATNGATIPVTIYRTHTVTIEDTDDPPTVYFTQNTQTAPEGVTAQVIAELTAVSALEVRVPLAYAGTAVNPTDYVPNGLGDSTAGELVFLPGSVEATLELTLVLDTTDESPETVEISMGTPSNATLGTPNAHILTISAVAQPSVFYRVAIQDVTEASTQVSVQVLLSNAWTQNVTVAFGIDPSSTASSGTDFSVVTTSPIVFTAGQTQKSIVLNIMHDVFDEPDETVVLPITSVTNATLGYPNVHVVNIVDNDGAPTVQFTVTSSSVYEHTATALIEMKLSSPTSYIVTVPFSLGSGTAIEGPNDDFTYTPLGSLTIPVGATTASIQVTINDDTQNDQRGEPNETVQFVLGNPVNATRGVNTLHLLTILEDDLCPTNYSLVSAGAKVTVSFNYNDADSPLTIGSARFDFQSSNVARRLSDIYQNNTLIFYSLAGALTGDYVEIPDAGSGYNWVATPQLTPATVFEFVFKESLPAGYSVTLSLIFSPGCDQVFTFVP